MTNKKDIIFAASNAIKPTLWFTNSILDKANLATDEELAKLERMTYKTLELKQEAWKIDKEIEAILSDIDKREGGKYEEMP